MASLQKESKNEKVRYRLRFRDHTKKQRSIWLGELSERKAKSYLRHVEELVLAKKTGLRPEVDTILWLQTVTGRLRDRLVVFGLAEPDRRQLASDAGRILGPFIKSYIEQRTDAKPATIKNFKNAGQWLIKHFGEKKVLAEITPADCDRWQRFLDASGILAQSTSEKIIKRAKTMFRHAVRDRLLDENPFADLKTSGFVNRERDFFITPEMTTKVLEECPNADWRLIFGLARFTGLRTPSETLGLKWTDIDWKKDRMRIDSIKTGIRFCPIFPQLLPILEEAFDQASEGAVYCVNGYRGAEKNLRTHLNRIIERAGMKPWPKLFVNLRASRRTELQEEFPDHVINTWLGHSSQIAEKHYLQVTDDHWDKATAGHAGGNICADQQESAETENQKTHGNPAVDALGFPGGLKLVPPEGLEPSTL